jgi:hypothetical protein
MRVELKNYMERVNKRFTEERKAYTERYNEFIADTNRKLTELEKNKADYSPEGYQKKREALNAEKKKNSETLAAICQRFNNSAAKLREACKDDFLVAYGITPKAIDAAALELIKLGVLSGEELLELAQRDYKNNSTMLRVIGNELQKSEDVALQQKGIALTLRSKDSPHLALFDELVQLCNSCMRPEYYGEDGRLVSVDDAFLLSAATANSYEGAYKVILDKAKQYSAESAE